MSNQIENHKNTNTSERPLSSLRLDPEMIGPVIRSILFMHEIAGLGFLHNQQTQLVFRLGVKKLIMDCKKANGEQECVQ